MKTKLTAAYLLGLLALAAATVQAQEVGRVISSTPVIQQVAVPRQVCDNQQVVTEGRKSGAGAAMGAIAGGVVGHQFGGGSGRTASTVMGAVGGAVLGDRMESGAPEVRNVQSCTTQTTYENRTTAYQVVYEYAGKRYSAQMPNDPGPTVRLQITPMAAPPSYTPPSYDDAPPPGSAPRY